MSSTALHLPYGRRLRVAVVSADAVRLATLCKTIGDAGHGITASLREADVVVCDGDAVIAGMPMAVPLITLGVEQSGQAGALPAAASLDQIDAAIRAVAAGLIVRNAQDRTSEFGEMRQGNARPLLTPRELAMLSAIGAGLSNKAIARQLEISLHTVKFHIESLFRKLGVRSRAEAVAKGLERRRSETVEL
jgi:DNA-binding CsgD family transcriptional regulator